MRFPNAPPKFTRRLTVVGTFVRGTNRTRPLDCLIDVSPIGEHPMVGYVFGNKEIADDISRIKYAGDEQLLFESSDGFTRISSSKVSIRHTASFGGPNDDFPHGLLGVACQFECLELHEQVSLDANARTREITFMLHGPRSLWGNYSMRGLDYTGAVTIEQRGRTLRFKDLKFSVTPRDHYVYASRDDDDHSYAWERGRQRGRHRSGGDVSVQSLILRSKLSASEYPDDQFLAEARAAVEDLSLLVSFLSRGLVVWFSYVHITESGSDCFTRNVVPPRSFEPDQLDWLIDLGGARSFLPTAFRKLRTFRANDADLSVPLMYASIANGVSIASRRFGILFLGLEALRNLHDKRFGTPRRVDRTFNATRKHVLKAIKDYAAEVSKKGERVPVRWWSDKLGALDRPSFWQGLEPMLKRFKVGWGDLYPDPRPKRPTFIDARNALIHSGKLQEDEDFLKETLRLEAVLQRVLLRWLGWQDLWDAPNVHMKVFLSGRREWPTGEDMKLLRVRNPRPRRRNRKASSE